MTADFEIVPSGDAALLVEFANRMDLSINARIVALAGIVRQAQLPGVVDVIPAFRSLGVAFDPLRTDVDRLVAFLASAAAATTGADRAVPPVKRIPVCYGGEHGPDLEAVAAAAGLSVDETIARHAAPLYRVFMVGFSPGFAYMGPVDPRIAAARRATPRMKVPAGSVGIAGQQTGIYPSETPGGWMLVGRTPLLPFRPAQADAFLFQAGDAVQFVPVDVAEYQRLAATGQGDR